MKYIAYRLEINGKTCSGVLSVRDNMTPDEIKQAIIEANTKPTSVDNSVRKELTTCCSNT